jgi:hypothetical protein
MASGCGTVWVLCHTPERSILHSHRCENLKSYIENTFHKLVTKSQRSAAWCDRFFIGSYEVLVVSVQFLLKMFSKILHLILCVGFHRICWLARFVACNILLSFYTSFRSVYTCLQLYCISHVWPQLFSWPVGRSYPAFCYQFIGPSLPNPLKGHPTDFLNSRLCIWANSCLRFCTVKINTAWPTPRRFKLPLNLNYFNLKPTETH